MEIYAVKKIYALNLLKAVAAVSLNNEWPEMSPQKDDVAEGDQGGSGGRLVGTDAEG